MSTITDAPAAAGTAPTSAAEIPSKRVTRAQLDALAKRVVSTSGNDPMQIEQPFTGKPLGSVPKCGPDDVRAAIERARAAQASWAKTSFDERKRVLLRYHDLVLDHQEELLDLLQIESGKARRHAFEEVLDVAITSRYYANTAEEHLKPRRRQGALPLLTEAWEYHHPLGVVGIIAPWNYPLTLSISDAIAALAAGNGVVLKPDGQTPFIALRGVELFEEAGLPEGLMQVVTGSGSELGSHIIEGSDYIMFTGSTKTGRTVAKQAGEQLMGASMELGGKNAMIVLADANVDRAVEGAERALFSNAGQLCISIERLFVHESVEDEFTSKLVERVRAMKLGTELDYGPSMGSLSSQTQLETVREHVDDAVSKGAEVLAGGRARPDVGPYFYEPTLLGRVADGMSLFRDETFGPVVAISRFGDEEDVIARANDSDYGLNFSLWTRDTSRGLEIGSRLRAGTVNVNEGYIAAWASIDAPMGGMKASGLGRRHGAEGIKKYTEAQTVAVQKLMPIAPPRGVPYRLWTRVMASSLRLLRRAPFIR
ncbi:MAG: succinate-semialdehyde dehydrogenase / glutarate-semialdehyde dehydrogenase [Thermoleophilaceae bacterium]|jgi:succinate-semialdehyde dehydrogenase/glutarate-semialdehyde dehydrogenase|nr:succinate-semialdehyde dehydrogenase / glutarate-semialdehyde dehydrogenase [Thermoleophilaceae bacterium]